MKRYIGSSTYYTAIRATSATRATRASRDNGPSFTMLLIAGIGSVMAGVWLAVVLAGLAGIK